MAISVQATAAASITSSRSPTATFSSWTPATDDVVVIFTNSAIILTFTTPAGWVNPLGGNTVVSSDSHSYAAVYHLVTSGEASGGTLTYTATNAWDSIASGVCCGIVLRGVDTTTVVDSANSTFSSANAATPHVLAGLTGTNLSTNSLVVSGVGADGTDTWTTPAGWTARGNLNATAAAWSGTLNTLTTAGTNVAATNITPNTGDEYASITIAFTESTGAPATPTNLFFAMF